MKEILIHLQIKSTIKVSLNETTNFDSSLEYKILKSKVKSDQIPLIKYYNVAEPELWI